MPVPSWLFYEPRHTNSTHLLLMRYLPTTQNNRFCSKNPRANGFINYPLPAMKFLPTMQNNRFIWINLRMNNFINYVHLAEKSILFQLKLLLFSFSPYPITHFASSSTTVPSQLVEAETWVPHSFTVSNTIPRATSSTLIAQRYLPVNIVAVITTVAILFVYVALWPMMGVIDEIRVRLIIYYLSTHTLKGLIRGLSS